MIWHDLKSLSDLDEIILLSYKIPSGIAVFKHSTRCSISFVAKERIESSWKQSAEEMPLYLLDLLSYRSVSDAIASKFGVRHESPQLLIIKDGKCLQHASHLAISVDSLVLPVKTNCL